ncbi:hypothetical protein NDU88_005688 [Pleurodeles waltl]|uniref:Uncharacterized protein n=1 Tax=Pleurodeles waltl TaxID=8319 RepID=A0AAV7QGE5_PLEWA|nr:hypothetical protein NDU88_005688 [Pleurodeles waltl]
MVRTAADVTAADVTAIFYLFNHSIPDLRQERTYTASAAVTSVWKRPWLVRLGKGPLPSLQRSWRSSSTGSSLSTRYSMVLQTTRYVECTGHQGSQCDTEPQHSQSPPCEAPEVGQCPAGEEEDSSQQSRSQGFGGSVDSAVTPPNVGKGQKKSPKTGRSSTVEKTAIIPAAQEATASPIVSGQEATARVSAQEATASHSPAAQQGPAATAQLPNEGLPAPAQLGNE